MNTINEAALAIQRYIKVPTHNEHEYLAYIIGSARGMNAVIYRMGSVYGYIVAKSGKAPTKEQMTLFKNTSPNPNPVTGISIQLTSMDQAEIIRRIGEIVKFMKHSGDLKDAELTLSTHDFYKILTTKYAITDGLLSSFFPEFKSMTTLGDNAVKYEGFELVADKDGKIDSCKKIIDASIKAFKKIKKVPHIFYGRVIVTPSLGRTLATYSKEADNIRISNKSTLSEENLRIFIHELGHRIYSKHLSKDHHKLILDKYIETRKHKNTVEVKQGDIFESPKLGRVVIVGVEYKRDLKYKVQSENAQKNAEKAIADFVKANPTATHGDAVAVGMIAMKKEPIYLVNKDVVLVTYKKVSGSTDHVKSPFLVTAYAMTNEEEFFCEILSFALTSTSHKEILDWLNSEIFK